MPIPLSQLEKAAYILKTVAHPVRLSIIDLLNHHGELNVNEICKALDCEQSLVSHHLINMKTKGLLFSRRQGQMAFYGLKQKELVKVIDCLKNCQVNGL